MWSLDRGQVARAARGRDQISGPLVARGDGCDRRSTALPLPARGGADAGWVIPRRPRGHLVSLTVLGMTRRKLPGQIGLVTAAFVAVAAAAPALQRGQALGPAEIVEVAAVETPVSRPRAEGAQTIARAVRELFARRLRAGSLERGPERAVWRGVVAEVAAEIAATALASLLPRRNLRVGGGGE